MYEIAKDKPFYSTLTLLNIFLWFPFSNDKRQLKIFFVLSALLRIISLLSGLGTLAHLIIAVKDNSDIDLSEDIGDLTGFVGCMTVCLSFLFHHSKCSNFFNKLLNFKEFGKPPKFDEIVKRGNFISLMCFLYSLLGMLWYCFVSYMQVPECQEMNVKKSLNEPCGMVNPTWLPVKQREGPLFLLCYFLQAIGIFVYLPSAFAVCIISWEAAELIVTRINHLKGLFKDVFESENRSICVKQLWYCISYHQDILEISEELSDLVQSTAGSIFLTAAIVIGSLGTQMIKDSTPKAMSFVMGYILASFLVCHAGQRLIDESLDLTNYVYNSRWYEMDAKIKKDVVFIMARCQKPIRLATPGFMGSAGYLLFCIMIKTSYSYLTLLNQMV